jgi:hypothetical protein
MMEAQAPVRRVETGQLFVYYEAGKPDMFAEPRPLSRPSGAIVGMKRIPLIVANENKLDVTCGSLSDDLSKSLDKRLEIL